MPEKSPEVPARNPELAVFEHDIGSWDADIEVQTPNGPERLKGSREGRWVGGRWLSIDLKVGSGFEGHGVFGYDPEKKQYVGTWVDTMRSFLALMVGSWDATTRTMTWLGEAPYQGGKIAWREVYTVVDHDTMRFQNFIRTGGGNEQLGITATYRRRRS